MPAPKGTQPPGGSRKGKPNRITADLKAMILGALDAKGGQDWLEEQMDANPTAFMGLIGKVLPTTLQGTPGQPIELSVTQEERDRQARAEIDAAFPERAREE